MNLARGAAALDSERDDRARAARQQAFRQLMIGMVGERGVQHPFDRLVALQEVEHGVRIVHVPIHAYRQGLHSLQKLERVGRREARAEIAQTLCARAHDEGGRAELLVEDDAVIARIGFGQHRELAGRAPVEMAGIDDGAADRNAMAAEPLGHGMHDDVGAVVGWPRVDTAVAKVLSIRSGIFASCAISATAGISSTSSPGLPMVSAIKSLVPGSTRRGTPQVARLRQKWCLCQNAAGCA